MGAMTTSAMLQDERARLEPRPPADGDVPSAGPVGLAFSGGGIRSATFGLGFLQGLSKLGLLTSFDYLSTVSGGGYIGCWLSAWIHRHPGGVAGVMDELAAPRSPDDPNARSPEPAAVHHLRRFSNYLTPHAGLLSADTWALGATFLRNLLVNWLTLVPYFALALLVPILARDILIGVATGLPGGWDAVAERLYSPVWLHVIAGASLLLLAMSIAVLTANLPGVRQGTPWGTGARVPARQSPDAESRADDAPGEGMSEQGFMAGVLIPLTVCAMGLSTFWFLASTARSGSVGAPSWGLLVATGVAVHLVGFALYLMLVLRHTPAGTRLPQAIGRQKIPLDLFAIVTSGAFGGWLVWIFGSVIADLAQMLADVRGVATAEDAFLLYCSSFLMLAVPMLFAVFLLAMTLYIAMASRCMSDNDREWYARAGSWVLVVGATWSCLTAVALFGPLLFETRLGWAGALNVVSGGATWWLGRHTATAERSVRGGWWRSESALLAAGAVFVLLFLVLLATALTAVRDRLAVTWQWEPITVTLALAAGLGLVILVAMSTVDVNVFSLHAVYRDRLIRAYLGGSRNRRRWNRFTGFDPHDDMPIAYLAAPFFSVSEWPSVAAIARCLSPTPSARADLDRVDPELIAATTHVYHPDLAVVESLIDRWNGALRTMGDPVETRWRWERLLLPSGVGSAVEGSQVVWSHGVDGGIDAVLADAGSRLDASAGPDKLPTTGRPRRPLHIINAALNLVTGEELAWQERKAALFTLTPLHTGSPVTGFRRTQDAAREGGMTLGTAMAISGAAANPKMGCHSSPLVTFLLTLLNGRLGVWIGNPGDERTWFHSNPRGFRLFPMALLEAFGRTTSRGKYINLSDGGHVENLGVYELVRRGCRYIVAVDAGADEHYAFEDLGNALRKIRVDLGVNITFKGFQIGRDSQTRYLALGSVHYADSPPGRLLYVKPVVCDRDEPVDVRQYRGSHPAYPHESTVDQWFSESQFESYRALGEHIALTIGRGASSAGPVCDPAAAGTAALGADLPSAADNPTSIEQLFARAQEHVGR
jgi:hypothetical protein